MTHHNPLNFPINSQLDAEKDDTATAPDVNSNNTVFPEINNSAQSPIENLCDSTIDDEPPSSSDPDQLIRNIIKSADMACKATRVNRLLSYVSGIDYSHGSESVHQRRCGNPKTQNTKQTYIAGQKSQREN